MKIYKKCTAELYSSLVNDAILPSDDQFRFREISWKEYIIIMTINKKITNEKPRCDISREKPKVSALSSGKVDKYIL